MQYTGATTAKGEISHWLQLACWILLGTAAFHVAYQWQAAALVIVVYLFGLVQLTRAQTARKAFYSGLLLGLLVGAPRLAFFWTIFSGGAVILWLVFGFWIALFVAMGRWCRSNLPSPWNWIMLPVLWTGLEFFRSELYYLRFAWLTPGYAFISQPGFAAALGVYLIGFTLVLLATLAAQAPRVLTQALVLVVGGAALWTLASTELPITRQAGRTLPITGIQMEFPTQAEVLRRLTAALQAHPETELFVLSEYTFNEPVPGRSQRVVPEKSSARVVGCH
jgi:uncharacterized membrane protein